MAETNFAKRGGVATATPGTSADYADTPINCIDCNESFIWTAGEQAFFSRKELLNPPKRCKECKRAKNRRLAAIEMAQATGKPHKIEVNAQSASAGKRPPSPFTLHRAARFFAGTASISKKKASRRK